MRHQQLFECEYCIYAPIWVYVHQCTSENPIMNSRNFENTSEYLFTYQNIPKISSSMSLPRPPHMGASFCPTRKPSTEEEPSCCHDSCPWKGMEGRFWGPSQEDERCWKYSPHDNWRRWLDRDQLYPLGLQGASRVQICLPCQRRNSGGTFLQKCFIFC